MPICVSVYLSTSLCVHLIQKKTVEKLEQITGGRVGCGEKAESQILSNSSVMLWMFLLSDNHLKADCPVWGMEKV